MYVTVICSIATLPLALDWWIIGWSTSPCRGWWRPRRGWWIPEVSTVGEKIDWPQCQIWHLNQAPLQHSRYLVYEYGTTYTITITTPSTSSTTTIAYYPITESYKLHSLVRRSHMGANLESNPPTQEWTRIWHGNLHRERSHHGVGVMIPPIVTSLALCVCVAVDPYEANIYLWLLE